MDFYGFSAPFTYEWSRDGDVITESCTEEDFVTWDEYQEIYELYSSGEESGEFVSYEIDEGKSLAVLTLTQCRYNQTYIDCVREMFTEVKRLGIQNVAVDLRGNGGGTSMVGNEFVKYLPQILGEASANSVNGYGEVAGFYLPNTGLFVQISTKKWYRIDENNPEDYVFPDYPCEGGHAMEELYKVVADGRGE